MPYGLGPEIIYSQGKVPSLSLEKLLLPIL